MSLIKKLIWFYHCLKVEYHYQEGNITNDEANELVKYHYDRIY